MTLANEKEICDIQPVSHHIDAVSLELLPIVWPHISHFLEKSLNKTTSLDAVYNAVMNGDAKLWLIHSDKANGCVVTGISNGIGAIVHCGGESIKDWIHLLSVIEEDFKNNGCIQYQWAGRQGWERIMKYDEKDTLYTRYL